MKVAVIGSRSIHYVRLADYLPPNIDTIISGGAVGVDTCAREYAIANQISLIEIKPDYKLFGKRAPLVRNREIVELADIVYAFWDGQSTGTKYTMQKCKELNKRLVIFTKY